MTSVFSTVNLYLAKRAAAAALIVTVALTVPVVLTILFLNLPKAAFFTGLMWSMLHGTALTVLYHTIPVLVAVGIIWAYDQLLADRALTTLYAAGVSPVSLRMPALVVALAATVVGYAVSGHFAPRAAQHVHKALYSMRHDLNPDLVRIGRFNRLGDRVPVVYFSKRLDKNRLANAFIVYRPNRNEERVYVARQAVFSRAANARAILLVDGSVQVFRRDRDKAQVVSFKRLGLPGDVVGQPSSGPPRKFFDEFSTPALLASFRGVWSDPDRAARWSMQAFKRFTIPLLALFHTFLGLILLARWADATGRSRIAALGACGVIVVFHFVIAVMSEQVARLGAWFIWPILAIIAVEAGMAIAVGRGYLESMAAALRPILPTAPTRRMPAGILTNPLAQIAPLLRNEARQAFASLIVAPGRLATRRHRPLRSGMPCDVSPASSHLHPSEPGRPGKINPS